MVVAEASTAAPRAEVFTEVDFRVAGITAKDSPAVDIMADPSALTARIAAAMDMAGLVDSRAAIPTAA